MRFPAVLLTIAILAAPAAAQDPGSSEGETYESKRYQVRIAGPRGWAKTLEGPRPAGTWLSLVEFTEPVTKATALLSVAATQYRSGDEMIEDLTRRFEKDASLAILRREARSATSKRPQGVLFEYTTQTKTGPVHAIAAYYLHLGKRFRVLGTVREAAWRTVGQEIERFAGALEFTGRLFSKDIRNFTDEAQNFSIYFPETWTVKLPARGPRVVFTSARLGVAVWIYVTASRGSLEENVDRTVRSLESQKARISKRGREKTHPAIGVKTVSLEYTKTVDGKQYLYRETAIVQRDRYYRLVLVGSGAAVRAGREHYDKMVQTISFLR